MLISKTVVSTNCLEDSTIRNPVHTSETRMCGDITLIPITAWRAVHRQSGTAFQADLLMNALYPRASSTSSSMHLGYA